MGLTVGVILGFVGVAILLVPLIIQIYVGVKETDKDHKRSLEAGAVIVGLAIIFYIGGLILAGYFSGKETVGKVSKFAEENPQLLEMLAA